MLIFQYFYGLSETCIHANVTTIHKRTHTHDLKDQQSEIHTRMTNYF